MRRRWGAWLLVLALGASACSSRGPAAQDTNGGDQLTSGPGAGGAPTIGPAPSHGPDAPPTVSTGDIVATIDGVSLTVHVDPNPVQRGEDVTVIATLRNDRATAVDYSAGACGFSSLRATFPIPWHPTGRTWTGSEGRFKDFVLNNATSGSGVAAWAPITTELLSEPCDETTSELLMPGEVRTADFTGGVASALGTYPHAATMTFSIEAQIDRQNDPPTNEPGYTGIPPRFFPIYTTLVAEGVVAIEGPTTDLLTAGEAIDVLLENDEFATWLNDQEPGACPSANLFLSDGPPPDYEYVAWLIQLICQTGENSYDGHGWVDAETGDIVRLEVCPPTCD
jgi:hypothetical protein